MSSENGSGSMKCLKGCSPFLLPILAVLAKTARDAQNQSVSRLETSESVLERFNGVRNVLLGFR